ncbi:uncharacterized protein [Henckelia pumila]|uniref:uncharacterized protein isoform X3 n=1 Tax=Henckelia pumila TaxID=405737 RepID=UPI003C6E3CD6
MRPDESLLSPSMLRAWMGNDDSRSAAFLAQESLMGLSKIEVNLRRLLATAPQQQNQAKLLHYVATLREQLEQLGEEKGPEGLPRVSKGQLSEYSNKVEAIATKLAEHESESSVEVPQLPSLKTDAGGSPSKSEEESVYTPRELRRRFVGLMFLLKIIIQGRSNWMLQHRVILRNTDINELATTHHQSLQSYAEILQEDLTDEMVVLARQLKESGLVMNQSIQNTEKILDSTEKAVEHSLASTGHANTRAMGVYSQSMKTSCFTWLLMFAMTCIFIMVVLLIRIT